MGKPFRAQSAVEFLTTYGWAILVLLVVVGTLYYFGVFSGLNMMQRQCTFQPGFSCDAFRLTVNESGAQVIFMGYNGLGYDIGFPDGTVTLSAENLGLAGKNNYTGTCFSATTAGNVVAKGEGYACIVSIGDTERLPRVGQMQKMDLVVGYKDCETDPDYAQPPHNCSTSAAITRSVTGMMLTQAEGYTASVNYTPFVTPSNLCYFGGMVHSCPCTIDVPGTYTLATNLNQSGTCITLTAGASGSTLNCGLKRITGTHSAGSIGISVDGASNVTVQNCNVANFAYGIYFTSASGGSITDNWVSGNSDSGIYVSGSDNSSITGNNASSNAQYGIRLESSNNNSLADNTAGLNGWGIHISSSTDASFDSNTACGNTAGDVGCAGGSTESGSSIFDDNTGCTLFLPENCGGETSGWIYGTVNGSGPIEGGLVNVTNSTPGWYSSNTTNAGGEYEVYGLVRGDYNLTVSAIGYSDSSASGITVIVARGTEVNVSMGTGCPMTIVGNRTLDQNLTLTGSGCCITIGADGVALDGGGFTITGDSTPGNRGVCASNRNGLNITRIVTVGIETGIYLENVTNSTVYGH